MGGSTAMTLQSRAFFQANKTQYTDNKSTIYFMLGLCEETKSAQKWAELEYNMLANYQDIYDTEIAAHRAAMPTMPPTPAPALIQELMYNFFIKKFKSRWIPTNMGIHAINKIAKL
jgi:hypothetical protein